MINHKNILQTLRLVLERFLINTKNIRHISRPNWWFQLLGNSKKCTHFCFVTISSKTRKKKLDGWERFLSNNEVLHVTESK